MAANEWRGEVDIIFDNKTYVLRPSFSALSEIEKALGLGFISVAEKLADGQLTLGELALIITTCADGITVEYVQKNLLASGIAKSLETVAHMFAMVLEGLDAQY